MADNFEIITENLHDPSNVRNFIKDIKNDSERKKYSLLFHTVYAVIAAFVVYLASDFPLGQAISFLLLCLAPAMCVFTFLYSPAALKAIPVVVPPVLIVVRQALSAKGLEFFSLSSAMFLFILCLIGAAVITKAVISGYRKTVLFVSLCIVFGIISFCQIMFAFIANYGTFSFGLLLETINSFFDNVITSSVAAAQSSEGLEIFRSLASNGKELTDAEIVKLVKDSVKLSVSVVKPILPSLFAFSCMLYGFVTVAIFSVFAKHFRINVFVCIMDKEWTYRPGIVSAVVYDIVFFIFVISMFVNMPENISATVMNLLFVLTPLMYISGVRGIYTMLLKHNKNAAKSRIITAVIVVAATMFLGAISFLIVGSAGVTFISSRNREEKAALPLVYATDLQLLHKLSESRDEVSDKQSPSDTENCDNTENK